MEYVRVALLMGFLALGGCTSVTCCMGLSFDEKDSIHYVVIGLGIVTVPKQASETAVLATRTQALGVQLSDQPGAKLGLGYSSGSVVAIPNTAEDVRVEISERIGGSIVVESPSSTLQKNGRIK